MRRVLATIVGLLLPTPVLADSYWNTIKTPVVDAYGVGVTVSAFFPGPTTACPAPVRTTPQQVKVYNLVFPSTKVNVTTPSDYPASGGWGSCEPAVYIQNVTLGNLGDTYTPVGGWAPTSFFYNSTVPYWQRVTGGSGNDTVSLPGGNGRRFIGTLNAGLGNDSISVNSNAYVQGLDAGPGDDTLTGLPNFIPSSNSYSWGTGQVFMGDGNDTVKWISGGNFATKVVSLGAGADTFYMTGSKAPLTWPSTGTWSSVSSTLTKDTAVIQISDFDASVDKIIPYSFTLKVAPYNSITDGATACVADTVYGAFVDPSCILGRVQVIDSGTSSLANIWTVSSTPYRAGLTVGTNYQSPATILLKGVTASSLLASSSFASCNKVVYPSRTETVKTTTSSSTFTYPSWTIVRCSAQGYSS